MIPSRGFTLVELLVVIAIIGMLLGISLPAVMESLETARTTACASNLRQVGLAMAQFTDTHYGYFPATYHAGDSQSWVYTLAPYLEDVDAIRICPDDPQGPKRLENKGTSYVVSEYISLPGPDSRLKIQQLKATSHTITVFEGSDFRDPESFYFEHVHPSSWFTPKRIQKKQVWLWLIQEIQPDRHASTRRIDQTSGLSHYLFADGHVERITASRVKGWADEGLNFALPDSTPIER